MVKVTNTHVTNTLIFSSVTATTDGHQTVPVWLCYNVLQCSSLLVTTFIKLTLPLLLCPLPPG